MSEGPGHSLTRREFDAVIRRAAELASSDPDGSEGALTEGELFRIAREVGLSEGHVRRALAEVRTGFQGGGPLDRVFGPASVRASRTVPGKAADLAGTLDDFFVASQLLQRVRRGPSVLQYRPALDWASQLARAASFTSRRIWPIFCSTTITDFAPAHFSRTIVSGKGHNVCSSSSPSFSPLKRLFSTTCREERAAEP